MIQYISWVPLLEAVAVDCGCDPYTISYLSNRCKNEGVRFLTVTLPKLGKSILRSIEVGYFDRPTDFAWKGRSLRYFRSLLDRIFSFTTGALLPDYCVISFNYIRQLCEYAYKLGLEFTEKQLADSEEKYISTQESVSAFQFDAAWVEELRRNAETHYPDLFKVHAHHILEYGPRLGPGSFVGSGRIPKDYGVPWYIWKLLPDETTGTCSNEFAPYSGYFKPYPSAPTKVFSRDVEKTCEVRFVKKDSRGPRVISKEPMLQLKAQMAFFSWASTTLERITQRRINFVDQSINQRLAELASVDRSMATMDLKDASDRVSYRLVKSIFENAPGVRYFLLHGRSTSYRLPSGRSGKLASLSGMGSGLTFPILAFVIHLSVCSYVVKRTGHKYNYVRDRVYVYGDDLIVPREWYDHALTGLSLAGLLVNHEKSYSKGPFRESCGGDYINGNACAPVRLKLQFCELPTPSAARDGIYFGRGNADIVKGLVAHSHELHKAGMPCTARFWELHLSKVIPMPYVGAGSPVLGRYTWDSSQIYRQAKGGDASAPDGYLQKVAFVAPVLEPAEHRCPYKFLSSRISPSEQTPIQLLLGSNGGVTPFEVSPAPRRLRLKFGRVSVLAATKVVGEA